MFTPPTVMSVLFAIVAIFLANYAFCHPRNFRCVAIIIMLFLILLLYSIDKKIALIAENCAPSRPFVYDADTDGK